MRRSAYSLTIALLLLVLAVAVFGCGGTDTDSDSPEAPAASASTETSAPPTTQPPSTSTTVPSQLLEPQFGETTRPQPGAVILSDEAKAFVPPASMPLYRIVATPITDVAMIELADRLGMADDRTYSFEQTLGLHSWVDDGQWNLMFFRNDLDCFHLRAPEGDSDAMRAFERGEEVRAVSEEEAIAVADEYLATLGYREGLGPPKAFVRTSVGRSGGGQPDVSDLVITRGVGYAVEVGGLRLIDAGVTVDVAPGGRVIGFSHTVQHAEPDEVEVPILPVEKAAEDIQAGQGVFPNEAGMDNVSQVVIEGVELAYYNPPEGLSETHYRPVYVFRVRMADGSEGDWIVSAYDGVRR